MAVTAGILKFEIEVRIRLEGGEFSTIGQGAVHAEVTAAPDGALTAPELSKIVEMCNMPSEANDAPLL